MHIYIDNDNVVRLTGAQAMNVSTGVGSYLTGSATVTFRLQTLDLVDVAGETWPQPMEYITGSAGNFLGIVRDTVALEPGTSYYLIGVADNGADIHGAWRIRFLAQRRGA